MARRPGAEAVYECADLFRQRCLLEGRSLIWPERQAWTVGNLALFDEAFLGKPDETDATFMEKWEHQLADVPDDVVCIATDLMALYCLMPSVESFSSASKLALIRQVVSWRAESLQIAPPEIEMLDRAFENGIAKTGPNYQTGRFWEFKFYFKFAQAIVVEKIDPFDRIACQALAKRVRDEIGKNTQSSIIILHLLFPGDFEDITSHAHRAKIAKAFGHLVEPHDDLHDLLRAIRNKLSNNGADPTFWYYRPDIQAQWDQSTPPPTPHVIKIAPGHDAQAWQDCLAGNYVCVGWDKVGNLRQYANKEAFVEAFRAGYNFDYQGSKSKLIEKANELWTLIELKAGDRIVANKGTSEILAVGTVIDPGYRWMPERKEYRHTAAVNWDTSFARTISPEPTWAVKTVKELSPELWELISGKLPIGPPLLDGDYVEPSFAAIAARIAVIGLRIDPRTLRRYHLSLKTRGFVVLSGLSGSGKTWLAEAYAEAVGARHLVVSVAPNWTTNEDLLGYANPLTGVYHDTAFSRFLREAAAAWERSGKGALPFHVVLDEMNLARVEYYFAKFLSAMEVRARKGNAWLELGPDDRVLLTPNLFVIGTVNIDETTHGFADKVFDRAQLIEIEANRDDLLAHLGDAPFAGAVMEIWDVVHAVGPFTFRVLDEIAAYVEGAAALGFPWQEALDEQIVQKILPKMKGGDHAVGVALQNYVDLSRDRFPLSYARASAMLDGYQKHGFASYFG